MNTVIKTNEIVEIRNNVAFADSLQIAEHFGIQHKSVLANIEKLRSTDEKIGKLTALSFYVDTMNRKQKKYLLTKDAFVFVVQKFKGAKAHKWQWLYIEAFNKMEAIINEKRSTDWQLTRENGKMARRKEVDVIAKFIQYAQLQGSTNAAHYYKHFTDLVHKAVGIQNGQRDFLTPAMMSHVATFEDQISSLTLKLMADGHSYKDIYQEVKAKMLLIASVMIMPEDKYLPESKRMIA